MDLRKNFSPDHRDRDASPRSGIFHRIVQEIVNSLLRPFPVMGQNDLSVSFPSSLFHFHGEKKIFRFRPGDDPGYRAPDGLHQILFLLLDLDHSGLQPGHLYHTLKQKLQLIRLVFQPVQEFLIFLRKFPALQDLQVQLLIGDGSLCLMGDIRDQFFHLLPAFPDLTAFLLQDMFRSVKFFIDSP